MAQPDQSPEELPADAAAEDTTNVVPLRRAETAAVRRTEGGLTLHFALDLPKVPSLKALPTWTHQQMINGGLIAAVVLMGALLLYQQFFAADPALPKPAEAVTNTIRANVPTDFNPSIETPKTGLGTYVDTLSSVIGDVLLGDHVFVAPFASIRGDEGQPIVIGSGSNVQDGVVIHALETFSNGKLIEKNLVTVDGKQFAVHIGNGVSLAHQSQVHGPAAVGDHTFIGMQALVFKATVGKNVVVEPGAKVIGVTIAEGRYVPAGSVVTTQAVADGLPKITPEYPFAKLNDDVLHVNNEFAEAYLDRAQGGSSAGGAHGEAPASGGHSEAPVSGGH